MRSRLQTLTIPVPTARLLIVTLCCSPLLLLAHSFAGAVLLGVTVIGAVALLGAIDVQFAPAGTSLQWTRGHDAKLSLGAANLVTISLVNTGHETVRLRARDAVPALLQPSGEAGAGTCLAGGAFGYTYRVLPVHRGDYALGPLYVRTLGPLGLAWKSLRGPEAQPVKVYPNLIALRGYVALERVGRLERAGLVRSRRWGEGSEFERLRDYTADDEYRRVNWKATARERRPIVADYQPERSQNVLLVLDTGRMMSMRVPLSASNDADSDVLSGRELSPVPRQAMSLTRLDYSLNTALLLAFVSQRVGDRVGLLAFSDRVSRYVAPRTGRGQLLSITDALYDLEAEHTEPDFVAGLSCLASRLHRRSLVVVFTDFAEPEAADALVRGMSHIARRHLGLVVTVRDPATYALATTSLTDGTAVYQRAVARGLLDAREAVRRRLHAAGVLTIDAAAAAISPAVVNRYLEIKARGRL